MCGICGVVSTEAPPSADVVRAMCDTLKHRGPDDQGCYVDEFAGLGVRRLSIIDLASGHQPMTNENRTIWLVFNGEIYNYLALRRQFEHRGHVFRTRSDTEVILHAYEEYGAACVEHFNGMFAFAVWDSGARRLLLARDRLGIKPLFFWNEGGELVFGSELKALLVDPRVSRAMDPKAIDQFLLHEYVPGPRTIFREVHKLPPGHTLVFEKGQLTLREYWTPQRQSVPKDDQGCAERLGELLDEAVRGQMVSDVPVGILLSGGIDSSTVLSLMPQNGSRIPSFSIGFEDPTYNELPYAQMVASRFDAVAHQDILRPDVTDLAQRLIGHLDEPLGDFSIFSTYLVSKLARESVKVVLSGDGGDEVFAGYETYMAQWADGYYSRLPAGLRQRLLPGVFNRLPQQAAKKGLLNKSKRFVEGGSLRPSLRHARWMTFLTAEDKRELYMPDFWRQLGDPRSIGPIEERFARAHAAGFDPLAQQQYVDVATYLADDILTKVDRMSMAASLEVRVPLLDHRIVEFALSLPPHLKLHRLRTKVLLRRVMKNRLPTPILRRPKQGFSIPLKHWLRKELRPLLLDVLTPDTIRRRGYFEEETVTRWITEHMQGRVNHSHRLWALLLLELWQQANSDSAVATYAHVSPLAAARHVG